MKGRNGYSFLPHETVYCFSLFWSNQTYYQSKFPTKDDQDEHMQGYRKHDKPASHLGFYRRQARKKFYGSKNVFSSTHIRS